jgi:putative tricarboxylic transport membrane protein
MIKYDRISMLFLMGVAFLICVESVRMGVGSLSDPGIGLVPMACGLILGILGLVGFAGTLKKEETEAVVIWQRGISWRKMISVLISLVSYAFLIDLLGFSLTTLIWTAFMFRGLARMGWIVTLLASVVSTFFCSLVFEYYLGIRFPRGIFSLF